MKYYVAMFDGWPIAVSTKSERHAKALAKAYMHEQYKDYTPVERFSLNSHKVSRIAVVEQQE